MKETAVTTESTRRRVATYERVSSEDQRERQTIKTQTEALARELDRSTDVELVGRYADDGVSGTVPMHERPAGRRLLDEAERGLFDEVWVYDLTRLARNTSDATHVRDTLESLGIAVCIDGRAVEPFVYDVHAALASEERRRIRKRSMDGANRAAAEGRYVGGIVPFGYRVDGQRPNARLVPDDPPVWGNLSAAEIVRRIYNRLAVDRWSCIRVAEELNALGVPTVYVRDGRGVRGKRTAGVWRGGRIRNLVVNTTYRGQYLYGKRTKQRRERITARVPRLVSDETWYAAQSTLKANLLVPTNARRPYLLRSVMRCSICGLTYAGTTSHGDTWYRCGGQIKQRGKFEGRCVGKSVKGEHIESVVWTDIEAWLRNPGALLDELRNQATDDSATAVIEAARTTLDVALVALDARRDRRLDQHERGLIDDIELSAAIEQITTERVGIEARLANLRSEATERPFLPTKLIDEIHARLDTGLTEQERQEIVHCLVAGIVVSTEIDETGKKAACAVVEYRLPPHAGTTDRTACPDSGSTCSSDYPHGCPCGYYGDARRACTCAAAVVSRYQRRISGPLLDRFDLFIDVPRVEYEELSGEPTGEPSARVRDRVAGARAVQARRFAGTAVLTNAEMGPLAVREFCQRALVPAARPLLATAMQQLGLSARAFHRVLKVARTVADLAGSEAIEMHHLAEAIQYRRRGTD